jgi:hypothetical protein
VIINKSQIKVSVDHINILLFAILYGYHKQLLADESFYKIHTLSAQNVIKFTLLALLGSKDRVFSRRLENYY